MNSVPKVIRAKAFATSTFAWYMYLEYIQVNHRGSGFNDDLKLFTGIAHIVC